MLIDWDEAKRSLNLAKHGIDFADLAVHFDFDRAIRSPARSSATGRVRMALIGRHRGDSIVVIVASPLGTEALSLVSARPASPRERRHHGL